MSADSGPSWSNFNTFHKRVNVIIWQCINYQELSKNVKFRSEIIAFKLHLPFVYSFYMFCNRQHTFLHFSTLTYFVVTIINSNQNTEDKSLIFNQQYQFLITQRKLKIRTFPWYFNYSANLLSSAKQNTYSYHELCSFYSNPF